MVAFHISKTIEREMMNWNEVGKLYCLAQVNLGRALSWKVRRLTSKIRLVCMASVHRH